MSGRGPGPSGGLVGAEEPAVRDAQGRRKDRDLTWGQAAATRILKFLPQPAEVVLGSDPHSGFIPNGRFSGRLTVELACFTAHRHP